MSALFQHIALTIMTNEYLQMPGYICRYSLVMIVNAMCWKSTSHRGNDDDMYKVPSSLNILCPCWLSFCLTPECGAGPTLRHA